MSEDSTTHPGGAASDTPAYQYRLAEFIDAVQGKGDLWGSFQTVTIVMDSRFPPLMEHQHGIVSGRS